MAKGISTWIRFQVTEQQIEEQVRVGDVYFAPMIVVMLMCFAKFMMLLKAVKTSGAEVLGPL